MAIDAATVTINLLQLGPGTNEDPISCSTLEVLLGSEYPYETLSYCWGELSFDTQIRQDGSTKMVTQSLYRALRELRHPEQLRTIWIDQLCINQDDPAEKSRQVSVMQDIYRNSAQGIVWLGELPTALDDPGFTTDDVRLAFELFERMDPGMQADGVLCDTSSFEISRETSERLRQVMLAMMGSSYAKWKGVKWWERIWTVQEVKLPATSTLQWGHLSISFDILQRIASEMTRSWDFCVQFQDLFAVDWLLNHFCTPVVNLQVADVTGALGVLYRWRPRKATEPRDKIFALLGILPESSFPSITFCDYSLSIAEIYKLVTLDLIKQHRGLLPLVGRRGEPRTTLELPSWVLDWQQPEDPTLRTHDYYANCRRWDFYNCAAGIYVEPIVTDSNGLVLQGYKVDTIAVLSPAQFVDHRAITDEQYDERAREIAQDFKAVFINWLQDQDDYASYVGETAVTPLDAFRRSLIADTILEADGQEPDHRASAEESMLVVAQIRGEQTEARHSFRDTVCSQSFFITRAGYIGIGPPDARIGDEVWVPLCGNYPHVLRSYRGDATAGFGGDQTCYEHVGDAYVHGVMDGEIIEQNHGEQPDTIVIY